MNFNAAIFDLDGTLLNSMDIWEQIDIRFLQKRNLPIPDNYVTEICSRSFEEAAQYTIDLFGLSEKVTDIVSEWNEMALYEYSHNVKLLPHVLDYLLQLKDRHTKLAVATGLPYELFKPCLINNSAWDLFDAVCSTDEVNRGKEYPDVFELAAQKLGVPPQQCIVFDDVLPAIKSAKQAGMLACGVYDKYSAHHQSEIKQISDYYLHDFRNAPLPYKEKKMPVELWDLYNTNREKTNTTIQRGMPIPDGCYHLVVSVWLVNSQGQYLLSQRHPNKLFPLYWECTGGSVLAGESSLEGAVREVSEELGIRLNPCQGKLIYQTRREHTQDFYDVWLFHNDTPIDKLRLQETEVACAKWVSTEKLFYLYKTEKLHPLIDYIDNIMPYCE